MKTNSGFSLIELLVTLSIIGLLIGVIGKFQSDIISFNKTLYDSLNAAQDGKNAIKKMETELRSIQLSNNGAYPLVEAATSSVSFYTDMNGDGLREKIAYYISTTSAGTLIRQEVVPSGNPLVYIATSSSFSQLAGDIRNTSETPIFEYYDSDYALTSDIRKVRLIKMTLVIEHDPVKSPNPTTYTTQVSIRSLKDNL